MSSEKGPAFSALLGLSGVCFMLLGGWRVLETAVAGVAKIDDGIEMIGIGLALVGISRLK